MFGYNTGLQTKKFLELKKKKLHHVQQPENEDIYSVDREETFVI